MREQTCPTCGTVHFDVGDVRYHPETKQCTLDGVTFEATPTLSAVLAALASKKGQVAAKAYIMEWVYDLDADWPGENTLPVMISKLRKILPDSHRIETAVGRGYRLVRNNSAAVQKLVA
jgi:DNA-binding response OmpR family regulator